MAVDLAGIWAIALVLLFGFFLTILLWLFCRRVWVLRHVFSLLSGLCPQSARDCKTDTAQSQTCPSREKRTRRIRAVKKRTADKSAGCARWVGKHRRLSEEAIIQERADRNNEDEWSSVHSRFDNPNPSESCSRRHVPDGVEHVVEGHLARDASECPLLAAYQESTAQSLSEVPNSLRSVKSNDRPSNQRSKNRRRWLRDRTA